MDLITVKELEFIHRDGRERWMKEWIRLTACGPVEAEVDWLMFLGSIAGYREDKIAEERRLAEEKRRIEREKAGVPPNPDDDYGLEPA